VANHPIAQYPTRIKLSGHQSRAISTALQFDRDCACHAAHSNAGMNAKSKSGPIFKRRIKPKQGR
jgi:hypothetical protein